MVSNGTRKRWGLVVLGGAIAATLLAGFLLVPRALPNRASAVRRPSVVLVLVDAMRADRLGSSGHPGNLTPHLDRLAQTGWRFTRAYSAAPSTVRSVASLFTSTAPSVHRISAPPGEGRDLSVLPEGFLLLPEAFQEQGYRTAMVTTTGWVTPEAGYDQGVDEYILVSRADEEVLQAGVDFVARHADREFFLYLHLLDLHDYYHSERMFAPNRSLPADLSPRFLALRGKQPSEIYSAFYDQPETFTAADIRFLEQAYDEAVRETDRQIGALASRLVELGLGNDVLLVVTSDHGEQFGEHGLLVHGANGFYDEVLRVPLILSGGPTAGSPRVVVEPVSSLDVFPTLLDLADIEVPGVVQGRSLADVEEPEVAGAVDTSGRAGPGNAKPVLADNERTWKVVAGDWSYIFSGHEGREELYHLQRDPGELVELLEEQEEAARELRGMVTAAIRAGREHPYLLGAAAIRTVPMSKQVEETLRALGYLE